VTRLSLPSRRRLLLTWFTARLQKLSAGWCGRFF